MVMQKLRGSVAKIFVWVIAGSFVGLIVFEWGMDITGLRTRTNVLGEVDGEKIMADQYYQRIQNQIDIRRSQGNGEITDQEMDQIENQVWEEMIQEILMLREIKRRGIAATDSEVISIIKDNPPDLIRTNETFQTDGYFDMVKYRQALSDPRNDWLPVEQYIRSTLPYQKLQNHISAATIITPEQIRWEYVKKNEKANVKYIFFNPNDYISEDIQIDENDIETYYNENQEKYREVEKRRIDYVLFPLIPTAYDSQAVLNEAQDLLVRINNGEDFASLAETFSEDPTAQGSGGSLGFFGKNAMVKPFEDAAFGANVGEVVGPVKTQFGLHLIKVEERKTEDGEEKVRASHILLKFEPGSQTQRDLQTKAMLFAMDAIALEDDELDELIANDSTLTIISSAFFNAGGFIPGIGFSNDISQFVFNSEIGAVREEPFETDQGFIVASVSEIQEKRIKPIDDVQISIRNILRADMRKEMAHQKAAKIRSRMTVSDDFERIAAEDSLEIKTTTNFTRDETIPSVGRDPEFIGTTFSLNDNEISEPVEGIRGYYLIKLVNKLAIDEAGFETQKALLYQQLLNQKRQQSFTYWYAHLKEQAEIKDSRPNRS